VMVGGWDWEITFLIAWPVTQVILLPAGVPASLFCVNKVETVLLGLIEPDVVKNEEFGLRAEIRRVRDSGIDKVILSLLGYIAGVLRIVLLGDGVDDIANQGQGGYFCERVKHVPARVRNQEHVALMNRRPAADAGA